MPRNAATNRFRSRDFVSSLLFNGTTDTVVIPHNANQLLTTGLTLSAWIKPRSIGENSQGMIFNKTNGTNSADGFYFTLQTNERINFRVNASSSINSAVGGVPFNRWTHVSVTAAADGTANFYVNGALSGTANQATTALSGITTTNALTIGNRSTATDRTFDGWIDEPIVWNRVLTAQEISDLYLLGDIPTSGLVAGYLFNEGAGTTVNDFSPTANNGTITGATFSADVPMKARKASVNANMVKNGDFEYAPPFTAATANQTDRWIDGTSGGSTTNNLFGWKSAATSVYSGGTSYSMRYDTILSRSCIRIVSVGKIYKSGSIITQMGAYRTAYTASSLLESDRLNMIEVQPNTTYTLTGLYYINQCDAQVQPRVQAVEYNAALTRVTTTTADTLQDTSVAWRTVTTRFTTSATARYVSVAGVVLGIGADFTDGNCDVAFTGVSLTPVYPEGRVPANGNLVKNFDFEVAPTFVAATNTTQRFIDGTAAGSSTNGTYKWAIVAVSTAGTFSAQFDSSVSFAGQYSMKLSIGATGSALNVGSLTLVSAANLANFGIPVIPNTSYTATYRMRTVLTSGSATTGARMNFNEYDSAAGNSVSNQGTAVLTTTDWTLYTVTFTTAATTNYIVPRLVLRGNDGAGTLIMDAWFDDIYLAPTTNPGRVVIT